MPTIKDVAKKADVSIATVSNVINSKGGVSRETYERVKKVIKELNYQPSITARNLKKGRTRFVLVILPNYDGYYGTILRGIHSVLDARGYIIISKITNNDETVEKEIISTFTNVDISGYLIVPTIQDHSYYSELIEKRCPVIFLDRKIEGFQFSSVTFDNKGLVEILAGRCFKEHGCKHVMLTIGDGKFLNEKDCIEGFLKAYALHDSSATPQEILQTQVLQGVRKDQNVFYTLSDAISQLPKKPTCFIVSSTSTALTLLEVLHLAHIEAMVYSLDTNEWRETTICRGNLVKIPRDALAMGKEGALLLLDYMRNTLVFENTTVVIKNIRNEASPTKVNICTNSQQRIRVLALDSPGTNALVKLTEGFSQQYDCDVIYEKRKYSDVHREILEQMENKNPTHDIFMVDIPWVPYFIERDYLYNLTDSMRPMRKEIMDDYPEVIKQSFYQETDRITGLPVMATVQLLFYRKDIFANADVKKEFEHEFGFELHPPRTWTEFNLVADFFKHAAQPHMGVETGTVLVDSTPTAIVDEFLPRMWAFGGSMVDDDGDLAIHSMENVRALKNLKQLSHTVPEKYANLWWDDAIELLLSGECAMVSCFGSMFPVKSKAKSFGDGELYNKIGVMPVPGNRPVMGGWMLAINRLTPNISNAFAYISWLLSGRNKLYNAHLGGLLPMESVFDDLILQLTRFTMPREWEGFSESAMRDTIRDETNAIIDPNWVDNQFAKYIFAALKDEISSETALRKIEESLNRRIRRVDT